MAQLPLSTGMPQAPFVDSTTGDIALVWRQFLVTLWNRTGRGPGVDSSNPTLTAALAAETQQRQTADTSLGNAIAAERSRAETAEGALAGALGNEIEARAYADMDLQNQLGGLSGDSQAALNAEIAARKAADLLLVPIAQLCSLWAQCNLAFLPTADPGHGLPWLNNTVLTVGGVASTVLGLEDATGGWSLEAVSTDHWLYG
ncbi:MAG TPA: hypothetical protein VGI78_10635 [Acetobacteraceae bacterium]|jgi:hypothetical protein